MSYLINASVGDLESGKAYQAYVEYLNSIKDRLPSAVFDFAIADWHYDFRNPRCPHDAWVQEIKVREIADGDTQQIRRNQIEILLLGAYHDRLQKVTYGGVNSYSLTSAATNHGHGDWLIDEISLSDSDLIVHDIKLAHNAFLKIECSNLIFEEQLTSAPYTAVWEGATK